MIRAESQNAVLSSLLAGAFPTAVAPEAPPHAHVPSATLSDVTDTVLDILRPDLERRGLHLVVVRGDLERRCLQLVVEVTETSEVLKGDPSPVAQVMADLLEGVSRCALGRVMVRVALQDDQVVITARDDGLGIGLDLARELTERYGREISCCTAATNRSSEIVVRVRVPVSECESAATAVQYDWAAQTLLALDERAALRA